MASAAVLESRPFALAVLPGWVWLLTFVVCLARAFGRSAMEKRGTGGPT